ncbi:hypothetical protein RBH92_07295 [Nitrosomonas sp. sh817]|nr:hypothetical protein RBH92_07295 [Nitrosomonas sp. sh817]
MNPPGFTAQRKKLLRIALSEKLFLCDIFNRGCTKATALLHKQWLLIGTTYFKPVQLRPIAAQQIGANMMPYLFIFFIFIAKAFMKALGIKRKKLGNC